MTPTSFVHALAEIRLPNVFNPYIDLCDVHDRANAPALRRRGLRTYLEATMRGGTNTIWMGRDLGLSGGRGTGIPFTDEAHLRLLARFYPGTSVSKTTYEEAVPERTAAEVWSALMQVHTPPLLWNLFPFQPHEPERPFTNRKPTEQEIRAVDELTSELVSMLPIERIIAIGRDASRRAARFGVLVECVRLPSAHATEFRAGVGRLYNMSKIVARSTPLLASL
jgi:hypothetical protein